MFVAPKSKFLNSFGVYEIYSFGSLVISIALVAILSPEFSAGPERAFFPFLFVLGHYSFLNYVKRLEGFGLWRQWQRAFYPSLFLFQVLCIISMSYHLEIFDLLYLGLVPCLAAALHYVTPAQNIHKKAWAKLSQLGLIVLLSLVIFQSLRQGPRSLMEREALVLILFMGWVGILFYGVQHYLTFKGGLRFEGLLARQERAQSADERDRFFYHDMINQTHGLLLYLKQQRESYEPIVPDDQALIIQEVETMQRLLSDHFKLEHKNIKSEDEFKSFDQVKTSVFVLINHYFLAQEISTHLSFQGLIDESRSHEEHHECLVHFPVFYRIMSNLIKNAYEHKVSEVELTFDYQDDGLNITMKNPLYTQVHKNIPLEKTLGQLILHDGGKATPAEKQKQGLGLESAAALAESVGGHFSCSIEEGHWINQVFLPRPEAESLKNEGQKAA